MINDRNVKSVLVGLMLLPLLPGLLGAAPALSGASGLVYIPTAESLRYKEYNVGLDVVYDSVTNRQSSLFYKANLGSFRGVEVGMVGGTQPNDGVYLNMKYYLLSDASHYPLGIALGLLNVTSASLSNFYMVASKRFPEGVDAHVGFLAAFPANRTDAFVMLGLEYFPFPLMSLVADTVGEGSDYLVNMGMRFYVMNNLQLRIYGLNIFDGIGRPSLGNVLPSDPAMVFGLVWTDFIKEKE